MSQNNNGFSTQFNLNTKNEAFKNMLYLCEKVAKTNVNVLLMGESGSGKEIAAKYIHHLSKRNKNDLVTINCSSYTDTLLESELFGYEAGAFTGAIKSKKGKIEQSDQGTLFLDEIGDINLVTQVKLLRTLENKNIHRVGSNKEIDVNFRLITATNIDVRKAILNKEMREDFFYRISSVIIQVPSLRERKEDLQDMINFLLIKAQEEHDINIHSIAPEVNDFLYSYDYPGNIRELKNILDRMVVLSEDGVINKNGLPLLFSIKPENHSKDNLYLYDEVLPLRTFKEESEKDYLTWVLEQFDGNVTKSAEALEISARQLFKKISLYNIKK